MPMVIFIMSTFFHAYPLVVFSVIQKLFGDLVLWWRTVNSLTDLIDWPLTVIDVFLNYDMVLDWLQASQGSVKLLETTIEWIWLLDLNCSSSWEHSQVFSNSWPVNS